MSNPKIKFRYVIVKHFTDYAIHEAYAAQDGRIIAISGEPFTLVGFTRQEMTDIIGAIRRDISDGKFVDGDREDLYEAFDSIEANGYDYEAPPEIKPHIEGNVISFRK